MDNIRHFMKGRIFFAIFFIIIAFLLYAVANLANGGIGKLPENGEIISEKYNICIHTVGNSGSGEWVTIFSYICDKEINWSAPQIISYLEGLSTQGVTDYLSSDECVDVFLKDDTGNSKVLHIEKTFFCKLFNTESPKVEERNYTVDKNGKFVVR